MCDTSDMSVDDQKFRYYKGLADAHGHQARAHTRAGLASSQAHPNHPEIADRHHNIAQSHAQRASIYEQIASSYDTERDWVPGETGEENVSRRVSDRLFGY